MSPKRKTILKALGIGVVVEGGLCAVLLILGGIGPCGPTSVVSAVVLAAHAPAFLMAFAMESLGIPDQAVPFVAVTAEVFLWSAISYVCLRDDSRR